MSHEIHTDSLSSCRHYLRNFKLDEFRALSDGLINELTGPELGELYLYRAQLKALTFDETLLEDSRAAKNLLPEGSGAESLFSLLRFVDPNTFILFRRQPDSVQSFLATIKKAQLEIEHCCAPLSILFFRQVESEILYYTGEVEAALEEALDINGEALHRGEYVLSTTSGYSLIRCFLALNRPEEARREITRIIYYTKKNAEDHCSKMYKGIRSWVNVTTGWSGDTPRYYIVPDGNILPMLLDRASAMRQGISELGSTEKLLAAYAAQDLEETYTIRKLYADIYFMLIKFFSGDIEGALKDFGEIYPPLRDNDLVMPLAEYGGQILPFLEYLLTQAGENTHDAKWIENTVRLAEQFELGIKQFRQEI